MRVSATSVALLWWSALALLSLQQTPAVSGQRAVVSLGKRLQKRFSNKQKDDLCIVQGEHTNGYSNISSRMWSSFEYYWQRRGSGGVALREWNESLGPAANSAVVILAVLVASWILHRLFDAKEEDEDSYVQDEDSIVGMGGREQVELAFEEMLLTLQPKKKKNGAEPRLLLDGSIRGRARPGRMLAIMGPSGAGKSSLMTALAGRVKDSPKLKLSGRRYMNGVAVAGESMIPAAFVGQEVNFFPYMTVRETLDFRVELKLGSQLTKTARDNKVQDLIDMLGLTKAADTIVGNTKVRGISGGERKRLSIAVEMISSPSVIFLDEPTSGLDSTAAITLVQTLRDLADAGKTIVAVIHQPSQHVFAKFDDLLLVSEGKMMYSGELKDVRDYMANQGYEALPEMGTAEHILDCVSLTPLEDETQEQANERVERLATTATAQKVDLGKMSTDKNKMIKHLGLMARGGPKASIFTQFRLLLKRSFQEVTRGKTALIIKGVQQVTLAVIYGGIYSLGTNQASIQDRFGLLSLLAIGSANTGIAATSRAFLREKTVVTEELGGNLYRTFPYFVGKALSELPLTGLLSTLFGAIVYKLTGMNGAPGKYQRFLTVLFTHFATCESAGLLVGAISPNSDVALAIFPAVIVLNIIFDGKNISEENTPVLLRWIPKVGLIRWGFEGLCLNEFEGLTFDTGGPRRGPVAKTGAEALARFGLGNKSLNDVFKAQASITASAWALSYLALSFFRQRFLVMSSPDDLKAKK